MTFTGQRQRVLTIPAAAVVREDNRDYVFVETAPGRCRLRAVTLGPEQGDRRPVLAGLQPSETLVTDGAFHLNNKRRQDALGGAQ
jgi:cobalt-zinc-cadmium efflux system membrane fusion protein